VNLSLQRKLAVFLLLILCAPLYILLRFFYGAAFLRMVIVALLITLFGLPFLSGMFAEHPLALAYRQHYDPTFNMALTLVAVYVSPIHLAWIVFGHFVKDGRHDVDYPGALLVPFVHPWLVEIPVALALPFAVSALAARGTIIPMALPQWVGFTLPAFGVQLSWWLAAVVTSGAFVGVSLLTVEPPRLRLRRWWKLRPKRSKLRFDPARIAVNPVVRNADADDVLGQR